MVEWRHIEEFPMYAFNDKGEVWNLDRFEPLTITVVKKRRSPYGIVTLLDSGGHRRTRAISKLIATAFCEPPAREDVNTVLHKNRNQMDSRPENLVWRPRSYALAYYKQFKKEYGGLYINVAEPAANLIWGHITQPAERYGLLISDIMYSCNNYNRSDEDRATIDGRIFEWSL